MSLLTGPRMDRPDWSEVINGLKVAGYSLPELERLLGIPKSTLADVTKGAEPRYYIGEAVLRFWCTVMDRPPESVPRAPIRQKPLLAGGHVYPRCQSCGQLMRGRLGLRFEQLQAFLED